MKNAPFIFLIIFLFGLLGFMYVRKSVLPDAPTTNTEDTDVAVVEDGVPEKSIAPELLYSLYQNDIFFLSYPDTFEVLEDYQPKLSKPRAGALRVRFTVPQSSTEGTTLASDSYLSVEIFRTKEDCLATSFMGFPQEITRLTESGRDFSVARTQEGATGNYYEEDVYAFSVGEYCVGLRSFLHSYNRGALDQEGIRPFDRDLWVRQFAELRSSIRFTEEVEG